MFISPRHIEYGGGLPLKDRPLADQIDLFAAKIDGWHLLIADRCINGWADDEGKQCIDAPHHGERVNYIPDSGWAVLQMMMNYFEIIGGYKVGEINDANRKRFQNGFLDVFSRLPTPDCEEIEEIVYKHVRNGLYHIGMDSSKVVLRHQEPLISFVYNEFQKQLFVDPHQLIKDLRQHLSEYIMSLKDESQVDLRKKFSKAFRSQFKD